MEAERESRELEERERGGGSIIKQAGKRTREREAKRKAEKERKETMAKAKKDLAGAALRAR